MKIAVSFNVCRPNAGSVSLSYFGAWIGGQAGDGALVFCLGNVLNKRLRRL